VAHVSSRARLASALILWRQNVAALAASEYNEARAIEFYFLRLAQRFFQAWRSRRRSRFVLQKFASLCTRAALSTARLETSLRLERAKHDLIRRTVVNQWAVRRRLAEKKRLLALTFRGWLKAVLNGVNCRCALARVLIIASSRVKIKVMRAWYSNACLRPQATLHNIKTEPQASTATSVSSDHDEKATHAAIDAKADEKLVDVAQAQLQHTGSALSALRALEAHLQSKPKDPPPTLSAADLEYLRDNPGKCAQIGYDRRRLAWLRSAVQDIKATTLLGLSDALAKLEEKSSDGDMPSDKVKKDDSNFIGALKDAKRLRRRLVHTRDRIARHLEQRQATKSNASAAMRKKKKTSTAPSKKHYSVAPSKPVAEAHEKSTDIKVARLRRHTARLFNDMSSTANSAYLLGLRSSPPITLSSAEEEYLSSSTIFGDDGLSSSSSCIGKTAVI